MCCWFIIGWRLRRLRNIEKLGQRCLCAGDCNRLQQTFPDLTRIFLFGDIQKLDVDSLHAYAVEIISQETVSVCRCRPGVSKVPPAGTFHMAHGVWFQIVF